MKSIKLLSIYTLSIVLLTSMAVAENKGKVTSRNCPYSCRLAGIPKQNCKDWKQGNTCYVEDMRSSGSTTPPPPQPQQPRPVTKPAQDTRPTYNRPAAPVRSSGYVSSRNCPYSCDTTGLPRNVCRDWKEGNTCYVEDLTKDPQVKPARPANWPNSNPTYDNNRRDWDRDRDQGRDNWGQQASGDDCKNAGRWNIAKPRISINKVKDTGGFFSDKKRVTGTIEGVCLVDAGYFEGGRKEQNIPVVTSREFRRFDFEIKTRGKGRAEVRAYNATGDSEVFFIDDEDNNRYDNRDDDRYNNGYYN